MTINRVPYGTTGPPPPRFTPERLLHLCKALGDESRLRILSVLAGGERPVEEIVAHLGVTAPTVSHHLAQLRSQRVVKVRKEGNSRLYSLVRGPLEEIFKAQALAAMYEPWSPRLRVLPEDVPDAGDDPYERKVLADFMEGGRLRALPVRERKRLVVLRWLARQFEPGREYREPEVNEMVGRHHLDHALVRRSMVDHGLIDRPRPGVYIRRAG